MARSQKRRTPRPRSAPAPRTPRPQPRQGSTASPRQVPVHRNHVRRGRR